MRVTSIEMQAPTFEVPIIFSIDPNDQDARYKVRNVVGIDAEDIVAKFYGWSLNSTPNENAGFYNFVMKSREIVVKVGLNPKVRNNESNSDIREELYRAISATRTGKVSLYFKAGTTTVASIEGAISKMEASHFTKTPEVQLTVKCDDPMFRGITPVILTDEELSATNPVIVPDSLSTSPHGFEMQLTFVNTSPTLTIQDQSASPNWKFIITPSGGFLIGDVLHFSSEYNNKYLYLVRGVTTIQLMDKISPSSIWPILFPGSNSFHIPEIVKFNWDSITFYPSYWGV